MQVTFNNSISFCVDFGNYAIYTYLCIDFIGNVAEEYFIQISYGDVIAIKLRKNVNCNIN